MNLKIRNKQHEEGFVLASVLSISFLAVMIVAAMTSITIVDLVTTSRNRATIEARNAAESSLDTLYAVINRSNSDDLVETANRNFLADDGTSPILTGLDSSKSSGTTYGNSTVVTKIYKWSAKWFSVDEDGLVHECGLTTVSKSDDKAPCFKMRVNKVITNPFGNSGLQSLSTGTTADDYQNANNTRTEYIVDVVVRHMCMNTQDALNPESCVWSRYQQKIRKHNFIQHVVMSQTEEVAPQVYAKVTDIELQDRVKNLDNAYAANDTVQGNIHTNDSHVYVCDGFSVTQSGGTKNWITSGYDSTSSPGAVTQSAASAGSNFTACNGSSGLTTVRFTAARSKFPLPSRIGDDNGARLTTIATTESPSKYVLSGNNIRIDFRYDRTGPTSTWDKTGMMHPVIDGVDKGWYGVPSNGVISVNPNNGDGTVTVSGKVKGKLTVFSTGSINIANSLTYDDTTLATDMLGLYASKDIILNCHNDSGPTTGQCDTKEVYGLLWAGKQTLIQDPSDPYKYNIAYQGTIYNDNWNGSSVSDLDNPPILTIKGAVVSYHRGTFGAIESTGSGRVTSGWKKSFTWDQRFGSEQPPYMLRDALASYIRSTATDLACDSACS